MNRINQYAICIRFVSEVPIRKWKELFVPYMILKIDQGIFSSSKMGVPSENCVYDLLVRGGVFLMF